MMNRWLSTWTLVVLFSSSVAGTSIASAPPRVGLRTAFGALGGDFTIPPEWAGVWDIETVSETCEGAPLDTEVESDTLCSGALILEDDEEFELDCTGTVTSTTVDIECTGSSEIPPDCTVDYSFSLEGSRTGDTYTAVETIQITYGGTSIECDLFPDSCERYTTTGTRVAPEPANCMVPVEPASWSLLKARYR
jgi:hypothetical protein